MEEIKNQLLKFGNVRNLMKYFSLEEIQYTYRKLFKEEFKKIKKKYIEVQKLQYKKKKIKQIMNKTLEINEVYYELESLYKAIHNHQYFPEPSRIVEIRKDNGGTRKIMMPEFKDKIIQDIINRILVEIYDETIFCNSSFGYRNNRNCHDALRALNNIISNGNTEYILKADIKGFFDNINRAKLLDMLAETIQDKYFLMYIKRFLEAGALEQGEHLHFEKGVSQGGIISPTLGNVYLHYALDYWFETEFKVQFKRCRTYQIL